MIKYVMNRLTRAEGSIVKTMTVKQVQRGLGIDYRQALHFSMVKLGAFQLRERGKVYVPVSAFLAYCNENGLDPSLAFVSEAGDERQ